MNWLNAPAYDIQRPTGHCTATGQLLEPGQTYVAALVEVDGQAADTLASQPTIDQERSAVENKNKKRGNSKTNSPSAKSDSAGLKRVDVSLEAWEQGHRPDRLFSYWRSTVPQPHEKKKLFVDDEVLMDLLTRLGDHEQPERQSFRFVLALVLMRKRLLRYECSEKRTDECGQEREWWQMKPKGSDQPIDVLNPQINDEQIQKVTEQLGQILEAEL